MLLNTQGISTNIKRKREKGPKRLNKNKRIEKKGGNIVEKKA